ncbi:MAG: DNA circularization N-terminal domain-containing protein [Alphaproteobacteria bacterium]|nr:DNA circularization N-terminal domain-containing protein [Alphaproteobacteria bacterium]
MSWRDKLREAAFRGVPFFWTDTDGEIGRRFQAHEYPGQDDVYHEDLGLKTKTHRMTAYVWGKDALDQAARLRAVINQEGPGVLVHPILGEMTVACTEAAERHSTRDGGYVAFTLTFAETGKIKNPRVSVDTAARVEAASNDALSAVQGAFEDAFSIDGLPEFVAIDAQAQATTAIDTLAGAFADLRRTESQAAAFVNQLAGIKGRVSSLVRDPAGLAYELADLIGLPTTLPGAQVARALSRLFDFGATTPALPAVTATRIAQQTNRTALASYVRQVAVIEAARATPRETFANRTAAIARRDQVAEVLEAELMTAPDASYRALAALRAEVVKGINVRAARLPRLTTVTPTQTQSALVLAHEIYGDDPVRAARLADDVTARNAVRHPGFVPGGQVLEVTIDG